MKSIFKFRNLLLALAILLFFQARTQVNNDFQSLDQYISEGTELFDMPGMAIGIIKNGEVIFSKGYGVRNTITGEPVTPETIFGIASCTKAFTTAALSTLVDEGKIGWEDHVIDYYPEFEMYDPYITREMQVMDLVSHRSGLQTFDGDLLWYGTDYNREEIVRRIRFRENPYSFRSKYGYQNVMFIAAGVLIEKVTGMTWDKYLAKKIFEPLQMENTTTTNTGFNNSMKIAYPHLDGKPMEFINYDNSGPAASINTSVDDLLQWVNLMLNKGKIEDGEVFSDKQYFILTAPHTIIGAGKAEKPGGTHFRSYGLGWFMFDYQGRKILEHGGGLPGFHSKVVFIPEDSVGYVILANQLSGLVEAVYKKTLDFLVQVENGQDWVKIYYDWEQNQKKQDEQKNVEKEKARIPNTLPSLELKSYTGVYEDKMYGQAKVELIGSQLKLTLLPTQELFTSNMDHWHLDTFRLKFNDPFLPAGYITFQIDQDAVPQTFTIELDNPDFHFYKLKFERVQ
ncbi:MAG: serine hydrolase [Bacteroidales bacterium]|nr:serine hydrolase [Bacteroidales bacterium]